MSTAVEIAALSTRRSSSSSDTSQGGGVKPNKDKSPKKSTSLPSETVEYLKAWMMSPEHVAHPYPTEQEKAQIMAETGIELKQLTNWFVNNRKRYWKPRVEARLQQQAHAVAAASVVAHHQAPNVSAPQQHLPQVPHFIEASPSIAQGRPLTAVNPDNFSGSFPIPAVQSNNTHRTVSEASSSASERDDLSDEENEVIDELDKTTGIITRSEAVDVHILRPTAGGPPAIEDVTILGSVPTTRVMRTYPNCMMMYRFPQEILTDRKKVQSRRDSEIVRIKKHYLKNFLTQVLPAAMCVQPPLPPPTVTAVPVPPQLTTTPILKPAPVSPAPPVVLKRKRDDQEAPTVSLHMTRRPKYDKENPLLWRTACALARDIHDDSLPSLEEAAHLFGFAS
mmetsp:Transcript_30549/g.43327  ORF Transcript_30549/g.43327 Transcript_30549/m.43327 type:complete len:393 (+) Transcript_30549:755-1933(+)|eukprot:CAMPEP_0202475684 /NCGR_PEP_ID=MMETSP1360-20130828/93030_1 /ASSEMBLY_ACC=CAM_ASM_000848 /TAXON_ID=515479 /ORGANISM="Licmophora paradoxa, Strain CCMP2313" /LENGTH=392 /DNA_ID=CAMNT_0049102863 /DNA_START=1976 /DNA_END=3154 /DNA_ORIENTATION=-